jgi:CRP-like cAMP-binding protein
MHFHNFPPPREVLLFRNLSASEAQSVLDSARSRRFSRHAVITHQTEPAEQFFLLWRGRARYFFETRNGKKLILRWILPGHVFGISALIKGSPSYLANVEAVEDCVVLTWTDVTIQTLAQRMPRLLENSLLIASYYLSWYVSAHAGLTSQTAGERLAHVLAGLAQVMGRKLPNGVELDVKNEELADAANISPYTASRVISDWHERGIISKRRGKIVLRSPQRLFSQNQVT